jgi:uncharacterized protein
MLYACCSAAGRIGINQVKSASARRERQAWAGAADGCESDAFGVDEANMATIDGLALFDDSIFWTEVQLETPFSGGHAADLTNYSQRNGSFHVRSSGSQHRTTAVYGSNHGGSARPMSYASPHGSRHGADTVVAKDAAAHSTARAPTSGGGLYATNGHVSPAAKAAAAAGEQAV